MNKKQILYIEVDRILWNDWDPLRLNKFGPRDEYQSYAKIITELVCHDADTDRLAEILLEFETESMELNGNVARCQEVSEQIYNIWKGIMSR